jgi:nitronate monooxygenase
VTAQEAGGTVTSVLGTLGIGTPVLAAPMAGGPSTPDLVRAAVQAGSLGFLAGGYKTVDALADQIREVRATTSQFGVNLFVPNPVPVDPDAFAAYARAIRIEGEQYGLDTTTFTVTEDEDHWQAKVDLLLSDPVAIVSFTFGIPDQRTILLLRRAGTLTMQTVTNVDEARAATEAGVDVLTVQSLGAGGHSGTLTPERLPADIPVAQLVMLVRAASPLPVLAAGGIATGDDVRRVIEAGAKAAVVGTVLLRSDQSGASAPYRSAIADPTRTETVLTRAFSGRPARALRNRFVDRYDPIAPAGYPALHHLTSPIRKAAAAVGDPERISLWAGTGFKQAAAEPAQAILQRLAAAL